MDDERQQGKAHYSNETASELRPTLSNGPSDKLSSVEDTKSSRLNSRNAGYDAGIHDTAHNTEALAQSLRQKGILRLGNSFRSLLNGVAEVTAPGNMSPDVLLSPATDAGLFQLDEDPATISKTPTYEYYGFVLYLLSFVSLGVYFVWAYLPDNVLHSVGITYYASRHWALAVPIYIIILGIYILILVCGYDLLHTAAFSSIRSITDEQASLLPIQKEDDHADIDHGDHDIDELLDVPISLVNDCLYLDDCSDDDDNGCFGDSG